MKTKQTDIIGRARAGDIDAFHAIHEEYGRRILNFIFRMVDNREDAEDLTQNVFLNAFHELRSLQDDGRFEPWLYRIARNEVYQAFRRKRGKHQMVDPTDGSPGLESRQYPLVDARPTPQDSVLQNELGATIRQVLVSLPPKLREVFILTVIHELSYAQIAEIVGRSLLSVKTDIFRARSLARKALGQYLEVRR